jgi:hypothetical protein
LPNNDITTSAAPASTRWKKSLTWLWVPVLLVIASFGMSWTVAAHHSDALSPVDEWVYVDYLYKLPAQGMVHQGEKIGKDALGIIACDGVKPYGRMGQPCGSDYNDLSKFPYDGITSADAYTPVYFAITRVIGDAIHASTGIDQLHSWRLTGALWLGLASLLLYALLRQWRIPRPVILGLGLAMIASPFAWWTYTYVSTDAPCLAFGLLLLLTATKVGRGQWSGWWLVLFSVVAVVFKVTNVLGVILAGLYLLVLWLIEMKKTQWAGRTTRRPGMPHRFSLVLPLVAIGAVVTSVAAQVAWLAIRRAAAVGLPADQGVSGPLNAQDVLAQVVNFLPGTITANVNLAGSSNLAYAMPYSVFVPLGWICVAGVFGALWSLRWHSEQTPLVLAVTTGALFFAPLLAVMLLVTTGSYFPLPPRYGAVLLGSFLLLAGLTIRNRIAVWILLLYTVALYVLVLVTAPIFA